MNTENNKLIAEFLPRKTYFRDIDGYSKPLHVFSNNDLIFHSDWNWIMKVVEKIEKIQTADFVVYINVECCKITARETYPDLLIIETAKTKIEATYKAIVEFIKWYNQQKK